MRSSIIFLSFFVLSALTAVVLNEISEVHRTHWVHSHPSKGLTNKTKELKFSSNSIEIASIKMENQPTASLPIFCKDYVDDLVQRMCQVPQDFNRGMYQVQWVKSWSILNVTKTCDFSFVRKWNTAYNPIVDPSSQLCNDTILAPSDAGILPSAQCGFFSGESLSALIRYDWEAPSGHVLYSNGSRVIHTEKVNIPIGGEAVQIGTVSSNGVCASYEVKKRILTALCQESPTHIVFDGVKFVKMSVISDDPHLKCWVSDTGSEICVHQGDIDRSRVPEETAVLGLSELTKQMVGSWNSLEENREEICKACRQSNGLFPNAKMLCESGYLYHVESRTTDVQLKFHDGRFYSVDSIYSPTYGVMVPRRLEDWIPRFSKLPQFIGVRGGSSYHNCSIEPSGNHDISFNCEEVFINDTFILPESLKDLSIQPKWMGTVSLAMTRVSSKFNLDTYGAWAFVKGLFKSILDFVSGWIGLSIIVLSFALISLLVLYSTIKGIVTGTRYRKAQTEEPRWTIIQH
ncbi:TPA_asm: P8 [Alnus trirhavirus 1]|nr:TPA_asm: P8 [Alnus trirhavirus 1]